MGMSRRVAGSFRKAAVSGTMASMSRNMPSARAKRFSFTMVAITNQATGQSSRMVPRMGSNSKRSMQSGFPSAL